MFDSKLAMVMAFMLALAAGATIRTSAEVPKESSKLAQDSDQAPAI